MRDRKIYVKENLEGYKNSKAISTRGLASSMKINHVVMYKIFKGEKKTITIDDITKMAMVLNVTIDDLLFKKIYIN